LPELTVRAERRNLGHNAFDWDGAGEDLGPSAVPPRPTLQVISDKPPLTPWHLWHCHACNSAMRNRGMKGVYQHCKEKHLHRYLAEFDFRYNTRTALGYNDYMRAEIAAAGIKGKRLTYRRPHKQSHAEAR
jgi:ISXO2-like transposase domain